MGRASHERSRGDLLDLMIHPRTPQDPFSFGAVDLVCKHPTAPLEITPVDALADFPALYITRLRRFCAIGLYRPRLSPRNPAVLSSSRPRRLDSGNDGEYTSEATLFYSLDPSVHL